MGTMVRHLLLTLQSFRGMPWFVRVRLIRLSGISVGKSTKIEHEFSAPDCQLSIGERTYINAQLLVEGSGTVRIGANVRIAPPGITVDGHSFHHRRPSVPRQRAGQFFACHHRGRLLDLRQCDHTTGRHRQVGLCGGVGCSGHPRHRTQWLVRGCASAQEVRLALSANGLTRTAQNLNSGILPNGSKAALVSRLAAASP